LIDQFTGPDGTRGENIRLDWHIPCANVALGIEVGVPVEGSRGQQR
jgi:hypothetical protein